MNGFARRLRDAVIAGICGSSMQSALMAGRKALGILPDFQPYNDIQLLLFNSIGASVPSVLQKLLPFVSGALIWSSIFAWAYPHIPGRTPVAKGFSVGLFAWLLTGFALFPAIGKGLFATNAGVGFGPALLMLTMLFAYCLTLSLVYGWLRRDHHSH